MPDMMEIYQKHAVQYDELVDAEDWQANLWKTLQAVTSWEGKAVIEAGVGTGRVTALYAAAARAIACFDASPHMLERARLRLARFGDTVSFAVADNLALPRLDGEYDVFIEGWSFGHSIMGNPGAEEETTTALLAGASRNLRQGGKMILIETLGTCVDAPAAPDPALGRFYERLERDHGFEKRTVRTDYEFPDVEEADRICRFFFGDAMGNEVRRRGERIIPEWTGVWHR